MNGRAAVAGSKVVDDCTPGRAVAAWRMARSRVEFPGIGTNLGAAVIRKGGAVSEIATMTVRGALRVSASTSSGRKV